MSSGSLLIRADASIAIGTGHVMRCLALAQAWQDAGGKAIFALAENTPSVDARLRTEGFEIRMLKAVLGSLDDAEETASLARQYRASWVVADGYKFGADYQSNLKSDGLKLLFLDDYGHAGHYCADLVLNQNVKTEDLYQDREPETRLLLGPRFALLRREFAGWRDWKRTIPQTARHVLVTMGGSDPANLTRRVVEAIWSLPQLQATVVVGGSNPYLTELRSLAATRNSVQLSENATNMSELMAAADVAVSAAGTTSWEIASLGLPALLIVLADNQHFAAEELHRQGAAINLGNGEEILALTLSSCLANLVSSQDARKAMSERGRELVDGRGAARVVQVLRNSALQIRQATKADCKPLWELANDPIVRALAFSSGPIPWEDHVVWFESKMRTQACHIFIGEIQGAFAGQVRVEEKENGHGEIDVSVAREFRGQGIGSRLIDLAARGLFASAAVSAIHAYILPKNVASQRAFEMCGFRRVGEEQVKEQLALHYLRDKTTG
jgi:UDP-2,4-diacetamido-2,4,6-trideoxy-beta-L-altropyranose hydrolase